MIFQNININNINMAVSHEFMKICNEHPECKDCPLRDNNIQLQGGMTKCETGKVKGEN